MVRLDLQVPLVHKVLRDQSVAMAVMVRMAHQDPQDPQAHPEMSPAAPPSPRSVTRDPSPVPVTTPLESTVLVAHQDPRVTEVAREKGAHMVSRDHQDPQESQVFRAKLDPRDHVDNRVTMVRMAAME